MISALLISGKDAANFLQAQASNDIKEATYTAFLTPQAKIIALAYVTITAEGFQLITEHADQLKQHLERFIITEDVTISLVEISSSMTAFEGYQEGTSLIKLQESDPNIFGKYVSFTKGCFPGQEALAKFKNIGMRKREERSREQTDAALSSFAKATTDEALEESVASLRLALKDNPRNEDAIEALGVILGKQGKYQEAIKVMHQLEMMNPNNLMAQVNLSILYMKLGDKDTAEHHKSRATVIQFSRGCA